MREISLVIPCFQSSGLIETLSQRCLTAGNEFNSFELILVDDGSTDNTWEKIETLAASNPAIVGCRLDRNYGEHSALMAGFRLARGRYIFSIDDDLQHRPEDLKRLLEKLLEGNDLVYGQYLQSSHSLFRRIGSRWNGWIATILLNRPSGLHLSSFRGFSRPLIDRVLAESSFSTYVDALLLRYARSISTVPIHHDESSKLESRYNFFRLIKLHTQVIFSGLARKQSAITPKVLVTIRPGESIEKK